MIIRGLTNEEKAEQQSQVAFFLKFLALANTAKVKSEQTVEGETLTAKDSDPKK
jgi:hypothetical protein